MRLEQDDNKPKVTVIVKVARRVDGRWQYETFDSFNVVEATPEEVATAVDKAFGRKSDRKTVK